MRQPKISLPQQTHIQVSLNQLDPPTPIYFGSTRFFWDQGLGNFFPSSQWISPFKTEISQVSNAA
jgi:hypothetical protein